MPPPAGRPRHLNSAAAAVEAPNLPPPPVPRLLLVTAHPDDEALFFAPALLGVGTGHGPLGRCTVVDVLCLSNGDAAGLGAVRANELRAAVPALLGNRAGTVTVVDDPALQDGMRTAWDLDAAAAAISRALAAQLATAAVLTFDSGGVTGHPNHAAASVAVARVAASAGAGATGALTFWRLRSLPWHLAWLGPAALLAVPALAARNGRRRGGAPCCILTTPAGPAAVLRGLAAHTSQRTWWRVLGAAVRSASYVSVLEEEKGRR